MDDKRSLLRHFLAALAYRTQKALRDSPAGFESISVGSDVRNPTELVFHMTNVLGYARTFLVGGAYEPVRLQSLREEATRFYDLLQDLARHLELGTPLLQGRSMEQLLQGPFSDAMTHAGQLSMLRRFAGSPVAPENFIFADIDPIRLGPDQANAASPDADWPEAPVGWLPPPQP